MSLITYSNVEVYINGTMLTHEASVGIDATSGLSPVHTTVIGFSGFSRGSSFLEATIDSAVPSAGWEWKPDFEQNPVISVVFACGGSTLTTEGKVLSYSLTHSVDQANKFSLKLMCKYANWE